jgi:hypothetical protein
MVPGDQVEGTGMMGKPAAAVLTFAALALTSCVVHVRPTHALATPDSIQPADGVCADVQPGSIVTFTLGPDTPQPRCGKVLGKQDLRLVNVTGSVVTVSWDCCNYDIDPGAAKTHEPPFGVMLLFGVHQLHTSLYQGGGPEIWLVAE